MGVPVCSPAQWRQAGRHIDWRGHRIFVREQTPAHAQGTVLLVHGFPSSSWDWAWIWPALTAHYRVVAFDCLGFGFSDKPAGFDYTLEQQTDVLLAVAAACHIDRAHVVVHDYGVSIGQELLHRQRGGLLNGFAAQSVCFLNGGLFPETHRARFIQRLLNSPVGALVARLGNERTFRRSFSAVFAAASQPSDAELAAHWSIITEQNGHRIFHRLIRYINDRKRRRSDWLEALRHSPVPIRLINGLDDPVSGAHMVERYEAVVGPVDVVRLAGVGHYPQCEAPEAVVQGILGLIKPLSAPAHGQSDAPAAPSGGSE